MFATLELFYGFEKRELPRLPMRPLHAFSRSIKRFLSIIVKYSLNDYWEFTISAIHQAKLDSYFKSAHWGESLIPNCNIAPKIGTNTAYRLIYNTILIVLIRKAYRNVETGISLYFLIPLHLIL